MVNLLIFTRDRGLKALAEKALKRQDLQLITADSFETAATLLENLFISLMVVDFRLSRVEYTTLMAHVRGYFPDIPIISLSLESMDLVDLAESRLGAALSLPLEPDAFKAAVLGRIQDMKQGGEVSNVSPPLFAQLLEMEERSCVLRVFEKKSDRGGLLVFKSGRLVDARFNEFRAMDAACRILAWEAADVFIQNADYPVRTRIQKDLQSIIMTAAHMKDQGLDPQARKPSLSEKLKQYIERKMGPRSPVHTIGPAPSLSGLVHDARALGSIFSYGPLKLGFAENPGKSMLFVPQTPPVKLGLKDPFSRDTITQLVSEVLD